MDETRIDEANLFNEARRIADPGEQEQFVSRVCGANTQLRDRVLKLVADYYADPAYLSGSESVGFVTPGQHLALAMIGMRIGPYELKSVLGEGGMGVVFLAEQREPIRRRVALKLVKPGMDSREILNRFSAERQALALMDHRYIARALDAGTSPEGHPYFVMEYVAGIPITEYCRSKRLGTDDRLRLFRMACEAVMHAHQKGVIHRDLKPTNILVSEQDGHPVPKVIDFGVAKAISQPLTDESVFTGAGQVLGTLEYMSPEQVRMDQRDVDTRTDVYAMGILLYELLTGLKPFEPGQLRSAAFDEIVRIIREVDPPRPSARLSRSQQLSETAEAQNSTPSKLKQRLSADLDWVVMKAIEKDRSRRYESISSFADDIRRFLEHEPVSAGPPGNLYRLQKLARRNRGTLVAGSAVIAALVIGSIVSLRQAMVANNALSLAVKESSRARKSEDQLRQALYASDMRLAALAWQRNDTRRAKDLLKRHVPGPGQNDLRGVEWSLLTRQIEISSREVLRSEKPLYVVKVSPSGQQIAAAGAAGTIWILDAATLETVKAIDARQSEINGLDFSPDGRELLSCGDDGTVCRWNVATGGELLRFHAHNDVAYNVLFGHEPNTCISCGRERVIRVWDSRDGSPVDRLNWHKDHVTSMVVSARGVLVAGGDDCSTSTWDLREYRKIHDYSERPSSKVLAVACSLDTALIATGDNEGYVWLRRANSGALLALQNLPDSVQALAFSPVTLRDEQTMLAAGDRAGFVHILPVSYTSAPSGLIRSDALTQSGRHWEAHRGRVYATAFSQNGLQLFTAGEDGILKVWELDSRSSWPLATGVSEFAEIDAGKVVSAEGEAIQLHSPAETGYRTSRLGRLTAVRVEYAPLAQRVFIVDSEQKRLVRLDLEHLHEETVSETSDWIGSIAVTSDGASLAYETHADGHRNRQLHIVTQGKEHTFPLDWMSGSMAFAEDGHLLVPQEHDIRIYDAAAPRLVATLPVGRSGVSDIRLSPDGVHLAVACGDRSIHVWNWRERRELWSEVAHARDITSVAFSPDGETIATAGKDPFLRLWRWKQGALVLEFPLGDWPVSELAFTRDGRRLLVNGNRFLRSYELAR